MHRFAHIYLKTACTYMYKTFLQNAVVVSPIVGVRDVCGQALPFDPFKG